MRRAAADRRQRRGLRAEIRFESAQWLGKQGLVAAGVGITLIPTLALANVRDDIVLRSLGADAPMRSISIATLGCGYEAPAVEPMRRGAAPGRRGALLLVRRLVD